MSEQKGAATTNCRLCKITPVPSNFGSPRRCAFDENGVFTPDNWNCVTAGMLREHAGESLGDNQPNGESLYLRREDQSYAAMYIPPNPEDVPEGDRLGEFRGGGFIAMTWYKSRGQVEVMVRVDSYDRVRRCPCSSPLTAQEADEAITNLGYSDYRVEIVTET